MDISTTQFRSFDRLPLTTQNVQHVFQMFVNIHRNKKGRYAVNYRKRQEMFAHTMYQQVTDYNASKAVVSVKQYSD